MITPSGRVPEQGLDWISWIQRPCSGRTFDLGLPRRVIEYLGIYSAKRGCGRPPRWAHPTWARQGGWRALVGCALLVDLLALPQSFGGLFCSKKNRQKVSSNSKNFYFCTKNNTTVVLLKTASVRVSSMQIISKPYKIVVNMA